jgi:hypothetical protein
MDKRATANSMPAAIEAPATKPTQYASMNSRPTVRFRPLVREQPPPAGLQPEAPLHNIAAKGYLAVARPVR